MHPRVHFGFLLFISIIQCVKIIVWKKSGKKSLWRKTVLGITSLVVVWSMGGMLNIFYPYHATYEYKNDIQHLKSESLQEYGHFPDILPDTATNVKWVCMPSLMQGSGYEALFFYADDLYIEEIYHQYAPKATIYRYEDYGWVNKEIKKTVFFPMVGEISEQDRENVFVLILTDNQDAHHPQNSGVYINQAEGYVCFFAQ